jgi:methionyl aminopeptidase
MIIFLKSRAQIDKIWQSNQIVKEALNLVKSKAKPGTHTLYLNRVADKLIKERGAVPGFLNYKGFPYSICASVNDVVVHGFPNEVKLEEGDLLSIDIGVLKEGYYGDAAISFVVGKSSKKDDRLTKTTKTSLYRGIERATPGNRVGDISHAIQSYAESHGYEVVRGYGGHGVGKILHEQPHIPNVGHPGDGVMLKSGMVIAIEPMLVDGNCAVKVASDGWTISTKDGSRAAHFEHTIAITHDGPEILSI